MNKVFSSLIASGLILGTASVAQAETDLSLLFDNTVKMTAVTGGTEMETTFKFNQDNTVDLVMALPSGGEREAEGTWEVRGEELCTKFTGGPQGEAEMCNPVAEMAGAAPGDKWEFSPSDAITIKGEVIAGR